jgi:hypothetical protein
MNTANNLAGILDLALIIGAVIGIGMFISSRKNR